MSTHAVAQPRLRGDLEQRLAVLGVLPAGWDEQGEAVVVDPSVIGIVRDLVPDLTKSHAPRIRIYPGPDGGLQLEWEVDELACSLELRPDATARHIVVNRINRSISLHDEFKLSDLTHVREVLAGGNDYVDKRAWELDQR